MYVKAITCTTLLSATKLTLTFIIAICHLKGVLVIKYVFMVNMWTFYSSDSSVLVHRNPNVGQNADTTQRFS